MSGGHNGPSLCVTAWQFTNAIDLRDLPVTYLFTKSQVVRVNIELIVPTQRDLEFATVQKYLPRNRLTNDDGELSRGLRFANTPHLVYLLDGHHRLAVALLQCRTRFRLWVSALDVSLQDALYESAHYRT